MELLDPFQRSALAIGYVQQSDNVTNNKVITWFEKSFGANFEDLFLLWILKNICKLLCLLEFSFKVGSDKLLALCQYSL